MSFFTFLRFKLSGEVGDIKDGKKQKIEVIFFSKDMEELGDNPAQDWWWAQLIGWTNMNVWHSILE